MRRLPGQAVRITGRFLHRLCTLLLLVGVGASILVAGVAWRLSQGPLDLPWLAQRMQEVVNAESDPLRITIGHAALTWEGFRLGVDRPLDIRLLDIKVTDAGQGHSMVLPHVDVSLALGGLLMGRIQPRALEIGSAHLLLLRTQAGEIRLDFARSEEVSPAPKEPVTDEPIEEMGSSALAGLIAELAHPPAPAGSMQRGRFAQLRRVRIRDSTFTIVDRQLAVVWRAKAPDIDLRRLPRGGVDGNASFLLAMGGDQASVHVSGSLSAGDGIVRLSAQLADLMPAALARHTGTLESFEALDTRLNGSLSLEIGPHQALRRVAFDLHAGAGKIKVGPSSVLLAGADLSAEGTDTNLRVKAFDLRVLPRTGGPVSTLSGSGTVHRDLGRVKADMALAVDRVTFADLGQLWPRTIGRPAHDWITENITAGVVRDAHAQITLEGDEALSDIALTAATGSLLGENVTVYWLRPVPPIDRGTARLNILDPDTFEILVSSGRQTLEAGQRESSLLVKSGKMRITGIIHKDQVGYIDAELAGPIADALALLRNKRLHLFDHLQIDLNNPGGQLSGTLAVTVPMEEKLQIEQVPIQTRLHLQDAHFTGLVAGRDLDRGNVELNANTEGMKLTGQADIATIPTQLDAEMSFKTGPPGQVVRRINASGRPTSRQLAAAGLDAGEALAGDLSVKAAMTERRDGTGEILVDADLVSAALSITPIGWQKPIGQAATGHARVQLRRSRLIGIEDINVDGSPSARSTAAGDALLLRAQAAFEEGRISGLTIRQAVFGRTSGQGNVRFPAQAGPIQISFNGPSIDLAPVFTSKSGGGRKRETNEAKAGPPWTMETRFEHAYMANATTVSGLVAHVDNDGRVMRALRVDGQIGMNPTGGANRFRLEIATPPGGGQRTLNASADNAGDLLRAVDVAHTMQGGRLSVSGTYDDAIADHPLSGSAEIHDFRIQGAPALGRLLQAMTLYGLVDVVQGPGLAFRQLVAPFVLTRDTLRLSEARAFSASLGLTVKGRIDLVQDRLELEGTIVPAYFFNSLLGNLPLIGKLFSPEVGGGLFAASYSIRGAANDPQVSVNPLSALTPGFLRNVFGIF